MDVALETVSRWRAEGVPCALARVVDTGGSAPLATGTAMAVSVAGDLVGGVSGGCVDGAVYTLAMQVIADGRPAGAVFGPDGDPLIGVGPTCGGSLEVFVEPVGPGEPGVPGDGSFGSLGSLGPRAAIIPGEPARPDPVDRVTRALRDGRPVVAVTVLDGPCAGQWAVRYADEHSSDPRPADARPGRPAPGWATGPAIDALAGTSGTAVLAAEVAGEPSRVFVHALARPRLLVFGATAFAEALVPVGAMLGYRVTVCDARPVFAVAERFPAAEQVVRCWPHEYLRRTPVDAGTAICVLTHDPKFDIPLLTEALRTDAGYVGAMGSRRTHAERTARLREEGLTEAELRRLSSPIGLDLGARTAAETALSIAAEMVAHRRGGTGARLVGLDAAIHR